MKIKFSLLALVAVFAMNASNAKAAVLFDYVSASSTASATIAATNVTSGLTADLLTAGSGLTANSGGTYNWTNWNETSASAAITANDVFNWGFTVEPSVAGTVDLASLDIRYDRSSTGPPNVELSYSVGGGSFVSFFTDTAVSASGENNSIDLSGIAALQDLGVGDTVAFRLVGWGASSSGGTFDLENSPSFGDASIVLNGTVPEPTAALLGAFGLLGLLRRRR